MSNISLWTNVFLLTAQSSFFKVKFCVRHFNLALDFYYFIIVGLDKMTKTIFHDFKDKFDIHFYFL